MTKPIVSSPTTTKAVASVWKPNPIIATTDVQDDECAHISADDNEVTLSEEEIGNLFYDTL